MMEVGQDSRLPVDLSLSNQRSALEGCCSKGAGTVWYGGSCGRWLKPAGWVVEVRQAVS